MALRSAQSSHFCVVLLKGTGFTQLHGEQTPPFSPLAPAQVAHSAVARGPGDRDGASRLRIPSCDPSCNAVSGMVWVWREEGSFGKVVSARALAAALQMQFRV